MKRECPCHSRLPYAQCCEPFHLGQREPPLPEQLMRSRYSAFSLGLGEYLVKTLAKTHADMALPRRELVARLSSTHQQQLYAGLRILHTANDGLSGEVLFFAKLYARGADCSFAELSRFVREEGGWRYADGRLLERARLPVDVATLTKERFLAIAVGT